MFGHLPKCITDPENENTATVLQLAAFKSLGLLGLDVKGGLGLTHALGYPLVLLYEIPYKITLCITLLGVVRLKATDL